MTRPARLTGLIHRHLPAAAAPSGSTRPESPGTWPPPPFPQTQGRIMADHTIPAGCRGWVVVTKVGFTEGMMQFVVRGEVVVPRAYDGQELTLYQVPWQADAGVKGGSRQAENDAVARIISALRQLGSTHDALHSKTVEGEMARIAKERPYVAFSTWWTGGRVACTMTGLASREKPVG